MSQGQVALNAAQVELVGKTGDQQHVIDIGRDHLLAQLLAGPLAGEPAATGDDPLDLRQGPLRLRVGRSNENEVADHGAQRRPLACVTEELRAALREEVGAVAVDDEVNAAVLRHAPDHQIVGTARRGETTAFDELHVAQTETGEDDRNVAGRFVSDATHALKVRGFDM